MDGAISIALPDWLTKIFENSILVGVLIVIVYFLWKEIQKKDKIIQEQSKQLLIAYEKTAESSKKVAVTNTQVAGAIKKLSGSLDRNTESNAALAEKVNYVLIGERNNGRPS